jgi:hypothetical protein
MFPLEGGAGNASNGGNRARKFGFSANLVPILPVKDDILRSNKFLKSPASGIPPAILK